ncbi:MAG: hypothetical protein HY541_08930 [Deltaproteobacteria bacterium]|nr:hypothetical protein [Deltaproteobacteria bacterium]
MKVQSSKFNTVLKSLVSGLWSIVFGLWSLVFLASACGSLVGSESTNSIGDFELNPEENVAEFNSPDGSAVYRSLSLENNTSETMAIINVVFYNNLCADFSLYAITSADGNILLNGSDKIELAVAAGETVYLNIRYSPSSCTYTGYETTLYVYYQTGSDTFRTGVILKPSGEPGGASASFACNDTEDLSANYTKASTPGSLADGTYYLRVDRMRGYLYVPEASGLVDPSQFAVGTDVGGLDDDAYIPPFLEVVVSGGSLMLSEITGSADFCLPSPEDNQAFGDAYSNLTSAGGTGTIDGVNILVSDLGVTLRAEGIPGGLTLGIDSGGMFQISLVTDLSTGRVPEGAPESDLINSGLAEAGAQEDEEGDDFLPIDQDSDGNYYLEGSPVATNGEITLVGVGAFTNEAGDFIGSTSAQSFVIDNEAYIFIQLDVTVMKKIAE